MPKKKKETIVKELKEAGIEVPENASDDRVREIAHLSRLNEEEREIKPEVEEEKPKYEPKVVRCGVADLQDIENRLCKVEEKLGM